ncbi:MAG: NAD(P)H-dependent oxidoreductase [Bacteroidota bacterium]|nr:NAD(P)H-dependent oxidoreductase [Bacteroidota bacterium]
MTNKKNIFVIIGSASENSANEKLIDYILKLTSEVFSFTVFKDLKTLPHFDPELSTDNPPKEIIELRKNINSADGVIICTPEYIFSIPSGLKNAIEWCVATTIFTNKPTGLITASASGQKGHEELKLIMKTVMANFADTTTLLIQGVKGKVNQQGQITDVKTIDDLANFINAFKTVVFEKENTSH